MDSFLIPWLLSGLSVVCLIGCVEYNRRTGFKKFRAMEVPSEDALLWIGSMTELPAGSAAEIKLRQIAAAEAATEQLIKFYNGYNAASEPIQVPADVQGEYAIAGK